MKTRLLGIATMLLVAMHGISYAQNYDFKDGSLYYKIIGEGQVAVTSELDYVVDWYGYWHYAELGNEPTGDIVVPEQVTYDGQQWTVTGVTNHAFYGCRDLTGVTLPNTVTSIGDSAFYDCKYLVTLDLGDALRTIGDCGIAYCTNLAELHLPETVETLGYGTFNNNLKMKHLTLSPALKELPESMLFYSIYLEELDVPEGVVKIGDNCLARSGVERITLPTTLREIAGSAFSECGDLKEVIIPAGITELPDYLFYQCLSLESFDIPSSVKSIGQGIFYGCGSLKDLTISSNLPEIPAEAFQLCGSLTQITIPSSVQKIGSAAFLGCASLTSIELPEGVTSLGQSSFYECGAMTSFNIPASCTLIGEYAFRNMLSLEEFTVSEGNQTYIAEDGILYSKDKIYLYAYPSAKALTRFEVPSEVKAISTAALDKCVNLTEIVLPEGLEAVGPYAIRCPNITTLELPSTLRTVGDGGFYGCEHVSEVICHIPDPAMVDLGEHVFNLTASQDPNEEFILQNVTLYVPEDALNLYQTFLQWEDFGKIQKIINEGIGDVTAQRDLAVVAYYTIDGALMTTPPRQGAYLEQLSDGSLRKACGVTLK